MNILTKLTGASSRVSTGKVKRKKISYAVSVDTHELLRDLKYFCSKDEKRVVPIQEVLDRAVAEYARKKNLT